jgi:hypothetical protein
VRGLADAAFMAGFSGKTVMSRSSLPGLNRIVKPGGICISSVGRFGLRPIPRFLGFTRKTPKPRSSIRSPRVSAWRTGVDDRLDGLRRLLALHAGRRRGRVDDVDLDHVGRVYASPASGNVPF